MTRVVAQNQVTTIISSLNLKKMNKNSFSWLITCTLFRKGLHAVVYGGAIPRFRTLGFIYILMRLTGKSSLFYLCLILFCFCHQRNRTQFYVVLIVKSSDEECVSGERFAEPRTGEPVSKDPHSAGNVMNLHLR